jgi:glycosyltransferase involved in cell wall biosynthesis
MKWYSKYASVYEKPFSDVPQEVVAEVRQKLSNIQSDKPLVTVSVIGYNEERHLMSCLWSLSEMRCKYPVEVIGVDNDSKDHTADVFRALGVPYFTETRHSCGWARGCGLAHARGRYHINIDGDTMYPPHYVETMVNALQKKGVIAVGGTWGYIPDESHPEWKLWIYERVRDTYLFLQSFKRPELSVRGLVFAYHTKEAQQEGIRTDIKRGEDGSLALNLKKYGKIRFIRNAKTRAVTGYGTLSQDGSLGNGFRKRVVSALKNVTGLFTSKKEYKDENSNLIK